MAWKGSQDETTRRDLTAAEWWYKAGRGVNPPAVQSREAEFDADGFRRLLVVLHPISRASPLSRPGHTRCRLRARWTLPDPAGPKYSGHHARTVITVIDTFAEPVCRMTQG
jgi:hypothetical protein